VLSDGDKRCGCGAGHETFGECVRAKRLQVTGPDHQHFVQRAKVLGRYAHAREQGIQPQSPMTRHVAKAVQRSDRDGVAYRA
jgi:hypothetical protein